MVEFPGFKRRTEAVQEQNKAAFDLARRMLSSWVYRPIDKWFDKADLPGEVKSLSYALRVQACRQFRSVIESCKDCEGENAGIMARSLFETTLAIYYLLAPKFHVAMTKTSVKRKTKSGKLITRYKWSARLPVPGERCVTLSRLMRARLYFAHCASQKVVVANAISARHQSMTGEQLSPKLAIRPMTEAKKAIGRKWRFIQSKFPRTYSGLSVSDLADATKTWFSHWYATYKEQSLHVHGVDPLAFVNIDRESKTIEPCWLSNDFSVYGSLYYGNILFLAATYYMNEQIEMGVGTQALINGFMEEFGAIYNYKPTKTKTRHRKSTH
jgi:Family of unknown function (DUF5677)